MNVYRELIDHFENDTDVDITTGQGAKGIKYNGKMFAMFYRGELLLKLSTDRVEDLITQGIGTNHEAGGRKLKHYIIISENNRDQWLELSEESKNYIMS